MKKVLAIVAIAFLAMLLAPARTTTVHVVRYIPAGGTVLHSPFERSNGSKRQAQGVTIRTARTAIHCGRTKGIRSRNFIKSFVKAVSSALAV